MAYDEGLVERLREVFSTRKDVSERHMFGGVAFMVGGNMCCGVVDRDLMVRVGPDAYEEALAQPHARPMDFTHRPLKGFVYVSPDGLGTKRQLVGWVDRGLRFAGALPSKPPKKKAKKPALKKRPARAKK